MTIAAIEKLCEQQTMFKSLMDNKAKLKQACSKKYLAIKCPTKEACLCFKKKKKMTKEYRPKVKTAKGKLWFFKKKHFRNRKTDRCYICKKKGHFAKNCPPESG